MPVRRSADVLGHLFGTPVSPATVIGAIAQAGLLLTPAGEAIKQGILDSKVVCFDETGQRVNGRLNGLHSAGTTTLTW